MDLFASIKEILVWVLKQLKFWIVIEEYERGAKLRFGRNPKELLPGLHFVAPLSIDTIHKDNVQNDTVEVKLPPITTLDGTTIIVVAVFKFHIFDIIKHQIYTNSAKSNFTDISGGIIADVLTDSTWAQCRDKKLWTDIKNKINPQIEDTGIKISKAWFKGMAICRVIITSI